MRRIADFVAVLSITAWAGSMWTIGFLVAPVLFSTLGDRVLAGAIAGRMFHLGGWVGLACGGYLLAYQGVSAGLRVWRSKTFWLVLILLLCVVASQFGIQPLLAQLKAEALPREVMQSVLRDRFATWHGISSGLYVVQSLLALVLVLLSQRSVG
ncbi:MAG: DUF4149 domain-containing protein [Zoogloeaceae bacterium]|nr:DUF4149 domain-containing protein [Zoogloeaceae bacterium]